MTGADGGAITGSAIGVATGSANTAMEGATGSGSAAGIDSCGASITGSATATGAATSGKGIAAGSTGSGASARLPAVWSIGITLFSVGREDISVLRERSASKGEKAGFAGAAGAAEVELPDCPPEGRAGGGVADRTGGAPAGGRELVPDGAGSWLSRSSTGSSRCR